MRNTDDDERAAARQEGSITTQCGGSVTAFLPTDAVFSNRQRRQGGYRTAGPSYGFGHSCDEALLVLFLALTLPVLYGEPVIAAGLLGGTVISIDKESRQLTLQMPEGHATLFPAANEAVLKDVKVGDRVSIELDRDGKITKLIRLPIDQGN